MSALRFTRIAAWALVALAVIAGAVYFGMNLFGRQGTTAVVTIGGPFNLTSQKGETVTEADLAGHPSLIFFGYTFCPDVCPTTLFEATNWLKALGTDADRLKFYYVTVDPERDTKDQMASYLSAFDPRIVGLTGDRPSVDQMLKAYRVYSRKVPTSDGGYAMDHTASIYMLDRKATFTGVINYQEPEDKVLPKLKALIAG